MGLWAVSGAQICGKRKDSAFAPVGLLKGSYHVSVCDRPKHSDNRHRDSHSNEEWRS